MKSRKHWPLAALVLLVAASGCGESRYVRVSGRLTYKGEPIPNTYVTFAPDDGSRPSRGKTDADGKFALHVQPRHEGVVRGMHTVFLTYNPPPPGEETAAEKHLQQVIARYSDSKTTSLRYEVTHDGQFIEIKLDQ